MLYAEDMAQTIGTQQLIAWLDDAYAMESGLVSILENHASHFTREQMPAAARRIQQHVIETQQHAQRMQECLRLLNATPSTIKSTLASLVGTIEGAGTMIFRDQLVKSALTDYASEQFEIACYTALVSIATELGAHEIVNLCKQNLEEDQAMATWLLQQLPGVVRHDAGYAAPTRGA